MLASRRTSARSWTDRREDARLPDVARQAERLGGRRRPRVAPTRGLVATRRQLYSARLWRIPCARAAPPSSSSSPPRCRASLALLHERGAILASFTDKGDDFARTFLANGTYGFIPGHPSAYTQPLYGWFLIPLYWIFGRHWEVVGLAQIAVAVATTLIVWQIGRRWLTPTVGLLAGLPSRCTRTSSGTTCT